MTTINRPSFLILFLLISFGSVTAVLFTPALPQISQFFAVTNNIAQLTITLFLIGYAVGQLLYGPLSNRYGCKIALYIGIILEIVGSILCIFSANLHAFWLLAAARLIMALGASVGLKMTFTLVADSYPAEQSTKTISQLSVAFAITPSIGVAIGGFLTEHLHWQSCFYFMALYGLYLLFLAYRMPETAKVFDQEALKFSKIINKYLNTLKNLSLPISAFLMGSSTAMIYIFAALGPFIVIDLMHIHPSQYGLWNLIPPIGGITGSQLTAYFSKRLSALQAIFIGICIMTLGTIIMLSAFLIHALHPFWLFFPLLIIYIGISFLYANASTIAMQSVQDKATGSAMMSFLNMGTTTLCVLLVGLVILQSSLLLPVIYSILIASTVLLFFTLQKILNY